MDIGVLAAAVELARNRRPYVLASVVWRRGPSSGQQGSRAIIHPDGSMLGWLGGACAEPTVLREAQTCLATGQPRLLRLGMTDDTAPDGPGVRSVAMACESEGAMEVYLEPNVPAPRVLVVGRSPAVDALAAAAVAVGWEALIIDDGGDATTHAQPELVRTRLDLDNLAVDSATAIVVATQGHYDDIALTAALGTDAGYVGLVASKARAEAVCDHLRHQGISETDVARVHAPAGLDLGEVPNREIAVAILADLVARRAQGELRSSDELAAPARASTTDPVCGMTVFPDEAKYRAEHEGRDYFFCAAGCKRSFEQDPARYSTASVD